MGGTDVQTRGHYSRLTTVHTTQTLQSPSLQYVGVAQFIGDTSSQLGRLLALRSLSQLSPPHSFCSNLNDIQTPRRFLTDSRPQTPGWPTPIPLSQIQNFRNIFTSYIMNVIPLQIRPKLEAQPVTQDCSKTNFPRTRNFCITLPLINVKSTQSDLVREWYFSTKCEESSGRDESG